MVKVRQLPITAEWQDAPLEVQNFNQSNKQKLSANVAINLHQSILAILSCGVKLASSLQLFSSCDTKDFLGTAF